MQKSFSEDQLSPNYHSSGTTIHAITGRQASARSESDRKHRPHLRDVSPHYTSTTLRTNERKEQTRYKTDSKDRLKPSSHEEITKKSIHSRLGKIQSSSGRENEDDSARPQPSVKSRLGRGVHRDEDSDSFADNSGNIISCQIFYFIKYFLVHQLMTRVPNIFILNIALKQQ